MELKCLYEDDSLTHPGFKLYLYGIEIAQSGRMGTLYLRLFKLYLYGIEISLFCFNRATTSRSNCTFMELKFNNNG